RATLFPHFWTSPHIVGDRTVPGVSHDQTRDRIQTLILRVNDHRFGGCVPTLLWLCVEMNGLSESGDPIHSLLESSVVGRVRETFQTMLLWHSQPCDRILRSHTPNAAQDKR